MDDEAARVASLTEAESEALRALLHRSGTKDIARLLDKAPSTVEQRLGRARRKLGVKRSIDAAHILARVEGGTYGTPVYAPSTVAEEGGTDGRFDPADEGSRVPTWLPFPTKGRPWNAASPWLRLAWIALGILAVTVSALLTAAAMETVSRIVRQHF